MCRYVRVDPQLKASFWRAFCACRFEFGMGLGQLAASRRVVPGVMANLRESSISIDE
jgi:hypothetical protein